MIDASTPQATAKAVLEFRRYVKPRLGKKPGFNLIRIDSAAVDVEFVNMDRLASLTTKELVLHYGESIVEWEQDWLKRLRERKSGVTVLFGPPGCGKTTYLRSIMARLIKNCVFYYLPISEFEALSSPRFVGFWVR